MAETHGPMPRPQIEDPPSDTGRFGHTLQPHERGMDGITRIVYLNMNTFPNNSRHPKNETFRHLMDEMGADIAPIVEMNVNWRQVPSKDRLEHRTVEWWEHSRWSYSYNRHSSSTDKHLYGGTSVLTIGSSTARIWSHNHNDPTGLGRWTGTRYRGRGNRHIMIVSAYRPHNNTDAETVGAQHSSYFARKGDTRTPQEAFLQDLTEFLKKRQNEGDLIILGIDANENISSPSSTVHTALTHLSLTQPLLDVFGPTLPNTRQPGSQPIDAIYTSPDIRVQATGLLSFDDYIGSDHRVLWMDFENTELFGNRLPSIIVPSARRLKLNDPSVVERFLSHYHSFLDQNKLPQRLRALKERLPLLTMEQREEAYDRIDQIRVQGILRAEKLCRTLKMGGLYWTPELAQIFTEIQFWTKCIKHRQGHRIDTRHLRTLASRCDSPPFWEYTLENLRLARKRVYQRYKKYREKHEEKRDKFIEALAARYAASGKGTQKAKVKSLRVEEKSRADNRVINHVTKPKPNRALTRVIGPEIHGQGSLQEYTTQPQMESVCLHEGISRFSQGKHTPYASPLFQSTFGRYGEGPGIQQVLQGEIPEPLQSLPPHSYARRFLPYLARPKAVEPFTWSFGTTDFQQSWKKMKERTSAGGDTHFGHMKAMTENPEISEFEADFASLPFSYGFSPPRWRPVTNVFIEKKANDYHANKLRIIMLIVPEFNHNNKQLGRNTMAEAERSQTMPPEQGGSRKGRDSNDMTLAKVLSFDLMRQTLTPGALCSNDAKSCYDRILLSIASLCLQRLGAPSSAAVAMTRTIYKWAHRIRTAFGDSEAFFCGDDWYIPIHGIGQGNGAGPTIWACISAPLMEFLRGQGHGLKWTAPISSETIHLVGFAFVDDCDLPVAQIGNHSPPTPRLQSVLNDWNGVLACTGGALVPEKSFWYYIDPHLDNNGNIYYKPPPRQQRQLWMENPQGTRELVELVPVDKGKRTLGVRICPSGNMNDQFVYLRDTSYAWATKMRSSGLPRELFWLAFTTRILKTLEFPLATTTFDKKQCDQILAPALTRALQGSRVIGRLNRLITHGPTLYQGLGVPHLYTTQGIRHLGRLLKASTRPHHPEAQLIRASSETTQIESGALRPIWELPFSPYRHFCTPTWITHTWQFCEEAHVTLDTSHPILPICRSHDSSLTELFSTHGTPRVQRLLNWTRLYLVAFTTGDLFTASGHYLRPDAWFLSPLRLPPTGWPTRPRPPEEAITLWRHFLLNTLLIHPRTLRRDTPAAGPPLTTTWEWWYQSHHSRLLLHQNGQWHEHYVLPGRRSSNALLRFRKEGTSISPPTSRGVPVTIRTLPTYITIDKDSSPCHPVTLVSPPISNSSSLPPFLARYPVDMAWAWEVIEYPPDWSSFLQALRQQEPWIVTDGSYSPVTSYGTASVVLWADPHYLIITHQVPGRPEDQSPYRSECSGLHVGSHLLTALWDFYDIPPTTVHFRCDNQQALSNLFEPTRVSWESPSWDLVHSTRHHIASLRSRFHVLHGHVYGHQNTDRDPAAPWNVLPLDATLNVWADRAAGLFRERLEASSTPFLTYKFPNEPWILLVHGNRVVTDPASAIRIAYHGPPLQAHWKSNRFPNLAPENIAWAPLQQALTKSPGNTQRRIIKFAARQAPVGINMRRRKHWTKDTCPQCGTQETHHHFLVCPEANEVWHRELRRWKLTLLNKHTSPQVVKALASELTHWHTPGEPPPDLNEIRDPLLRTSLQRQRQINTPDALYGCWVVDWLEIQRAYFSALGKSYSPTTWLTNLIRTTWKLVEALWEHRNGILHDSKQLKDHMVLYENVQTEYHLGCEDFRPPAKALFDRSLDDLLLKRTGYLELWLDRVQAERVFLENDPSTQALRRQRALMAYHFRVRQLFST